MCLASPYPGERSWLPAPSRSTGGRGGMMTVRAVGRPSYARAAGRVITRCITRPMSVPGATIRAMPGELERLPASFLRPGLPRHACGVRTGLRRPACGCRPAARLTEAQAGSAVRYL